MKTRWSLCCLLAYGRQKSWAVGDAEQTTAYCSSFPAPACSLLGLGPNCTILTRQSKKRMGSGMGIPVSLEQGEAEMSVPTQFPMGRLQYPKEMHQLPQHPLAVAVIPMGLSKPYSDCPCPRSELGDRRSRPHPWWNKAWGQQWRLGKAASCLSHSQPGHQA